MFRRTGARAALRLTRLCFKLGNLVYRSHILTNLVDSVALELTHVVVLGALTLTDGIAWLASSINHWYLGLLIWLAELLDRTGESVKHRTIDLASPRVETD